MQEALHCAERCVRRSAQPSRGRSRRSISATAWRASIRWSSGSMPSRAPATLPPDADARSSASRASRAPRRAGRRRRADADAAAAWLEPLRERASRRSRAGANGGSLSSAGRQLFPAPGSRWRESRRCRACSRSTSRRATPWPPLDELDPFSCNLVDHGVARAARPRTLRAALGDELRHCDVEALADRTSGARRGIRSRSELASCSKPGATARRRPATARARPHRFGGHRRRERAAPPRQDR